jgi:hypothetical protein
MCNLTNVSSLSFTRGEKRAARRNEIGIYEMKKRKIKRSREPEKWLRLAPSNKHTASENAPARILAAIE